MSSLDNLRHRFSDELYAELMALAEKLEDRQLTQMNLRDPGTRHTSGTDQVIYTLFYRVTKQSRPVTMSFPHWSHRADFAREKIVSSNFTLVFSESPRIELDANQKMIRKGS